MKLRFYLQNESAALELNQIEGLQQDESGAVTFAATLPVVGRLSGRFWPGRCYGEMAGFSIQGTPVQRADGTICWFPILGQTVGLQVVTPVQDVLGKLKPFLLALAGFVVVAVILKRLL